EVELVAAARTHFGRPEPPVWRERQSVGVAVARGPRLGGGEIGPRPGEAPAPRELGRFRVFRRIGHRGARGTSAPGKWVAGRGFAVEGQAEDLAQRRAR